MAGQHGGYRRPASPAVVSGPGAHSRRTDGKQPVMDLPDAEYGGNADFREMQSGAPMPQVAAPTKVQPTGPPIVGLGEPSQMATTPVTDGAQYGPGAGPSALGLEDPNIQDAAYLRKYLPVLMEQANSDHASPGYKTWLRNMIASLPR